MQLRRGMADHKVETCWRVVGGNGDEYRCGIHRGTALLDVRVTFGPPDSEQCVHSELVEDIAYAREVANDWLRKVLELEAFRQRS